MQSFTLTFNHGELGSHAIRYWPSKEEMEERGMTVEEVMMDMIQEAWSAQPGVYAIPTHDKKYAISVNMDTVLTLQGRIDDVLVETE